MKRLLALMSRFGRDHVRRAGRFAAGDHAGAEQDRKCAERADADPAADDGLTLLPAILMAVTPFLRVVVVLHFLRQALGTQTAPSNQVLVGAGAVHRSGGDAARGIAGLSPGMGAARERANQRVGSVGSGCGSDQGIFC